MVGIFSRFSVRGSHRRTQSALDEREIVPPSSEFTSSTNTTAVASAVTHGIEAAVEFKPLERPTEPLDNDQPIPCPLPEPSILNDGRIWKERVSSTVQRRGGDTVPPSVMQEQTVIGTEVNPAPRPPRPPSNRLILPSISAPEHNILKLLEECNAS